MLINFRRQGFKCLNMQSQLYVANPRLGSKQKDKRKDLMSKPVKILGSLGIEKQKAIIHMIYTQITFVASVANAVSIFKS